jgi:hypothetical protein
MDDGVTGECVDLALNRQILLEPGFWFVEIELGAE